MTLFNDRYRVETTRKKDWDYSSPGWYFITICTYKHEMRFGKVSDGKTKLSNIGEIANNYWLEIPNHFPVVELDEYVIMPNHVHGIIIINKYADWARRRDEAMPRLYTDPHRQMSDISPKPKSIPTIIGSYKSICAKTIHRLQHSNIFQWQSRYYDHIIRNEREFSVIREYILTNPENWENDKYY